MGAFSRRIRNVIQITCEGVDLQTIKNIEFYVKQGPGIFFQYTPSVVSETVMMVDMPYADAMQLRLGDVELQFAFTDANGVPGKTEIIEVPVGELLKEAGYDPVPGS